MELHGDLDLDNIAQLIDMGRKDQANGDTWATRYVSDVETLLKYVAELERKLDDFKEPLKRRADHLICPNCGAGSRPTDIQVARDMKATRHCNKCGNTWEPQWDPTWAGGPYVKKS